MSTRTWNYPIAASTVTGLVCLAPDADSARVPFNMWDGEVIAEVTVSTCVYGFPSAVIMYKSMGEGLTCEGWSPYKQALGVTKNQCWVKMYAWIADRLNDRATGKQNAIGTHSDFTTAD